MRVIAGKLRHREIKMTLLPTTRETQDKVRGAIFNMIGPYFDGGKALDLFAGSGAMGIEAYSRGIESVTFNDIEPKALQVVKDNCQSLGIQNATYFCMDYLQFYQSNKTYFDYIFLDPPYRMNDLTKILTATNLCLNYKGIIVFEAAKESEYPTELGDLILIKNKSYGIKRVLIYQKNK